MSDKFDDGHGPKTCNWRECRAESEHPCPFVKDTSKPAPDNTCKHEWRYMEDNTFYCIFCLDLCKVI